ncbi:MAG: hypothetical protein LBT53_03600 [Puniceicoccales bacterium]|jgi:hypothetical protein|nr:hypothetical protein [Puniceicoccales bacterium]
MKRNYTSTRRARSGSVLCALAALALHAVAGGVAPLSLHARESAALATDYTVSEAPQGWKGENWQAGGWTAINIKKPELSGTTVVQLGFDIVSPYNTNVGPNFLLRLKIAGRFAFLTNSPGIAAQKTDVILMRKKGTVFEALLSRSGVLTDATVDYGKETVHYSAGDLNPSNANDPRFTSIRFVPSTDDPTLAANAPEQWEPLSLDRPAYTDGSGKNYNVAYWSQAKEKIVGKDAIVRIGFDHMSEYADKKNSGQNFLFRLVFKKGTVFLSNDADVAVRKSNVTILERKDGYFEGRVCGLGELQEAAVDFGAGTLAYGQGTWLLNKKNEADVRFNSLKIFPQTATKPAPQNTPDTAQQANPTPAAAPPTGTEFSAPQYYKGNNWHVGAFTRTEGHKLEKGATLRLHFDTSSCYTKDDEVRFLLRVVFQDGRTLYASNNAEVVAASRRRSAVKMTLNREERYFECTLEDHANSSGVVREIAVDFGENTSHLPIALNTKNNNDPRFFKLTILNKQ